MRIDLNRMRSKDLCRMCLKSKWNARSIAWNSPRVNRIKECNRLFKWTLITFEHKTTYSDLNYPCVFLRLVAFPFEMRFIPFGAQHWIEISEKILHIICQATENQCDEKKNEKIQFNNSISGIYCCSYSIWSHPHIRFCLLIHLERMCGSVARPEPRPHNIIKCWRFGSLNLVMKIMIKTFIYYFHIILEFVMPLAVNCDTVCNMVALLLKVNSRKPTI